jgi:oligoribonuclease
VTVEPEYLLWLDLETTGADSENDYILEVGCVLTDMELNDLGAWESLVWAPYKMLERMVPEVKEMHTESGLIDDWKVFYHKVEDNREYPSRSAESVGAQCLDWLNGHPLAPNLNLSGTYSNIMIAGSGVGHFDNRFLYKRMSAFRRFFQYPMMDVGVLGRAFKFWCPTYYKDIDSDRPHRALPDARLALEKGRWYKSLLDQIDAEPGQFNPQMAANFQYGSRSEQREQVMMQQTPSSTSLVLPKKPERFYDDLSTD